MRKISYLTITVLLNLIIFRFFYDYIERNYPLSYKDKQIVYLEEKYQKTKDLNTLVDMAWVYYEKGDIEKARMLVEDVLKDNLGKQNQAALYIDALFKYKEKNYIGAREQLNKLLSQTKNKHELGLYLLSQIEYENKEIDKALETINQLITLNNLSGDYYFLRGKIYIEKGELDKARQDMEKTLQFLPDHKDAKRLYGKIIEEKKKMGDKNDGN